MSATFMYVAGFAPANFKDRDFSGHACDMTEDQILRLFDFVLNEEDADEHWERTNSALEALEALETLEFAFEKAGGRGVEMADELDAMRLDQRRDHVQYKIDEAVKHLREHGQHRNADFEGWLLYETGGMSWGDPPTDEYDPICLLLEVGIFEPSCGPRPNIEVRREKKDLARLLRCAAAFMETPGDLDDSGRAHLNEDLLDAADALHPENEEN